MLTAIIHKALPNHKNSSKKVIMENKNIFQSQSEIKINVLKVDNKKLTRSLVEQFRNENPFDAELNFVGDKIFGYILVNRPANNGKDRIIIAQKNGKLIKYSWIKILGLSYIESESSWNDVRNNHKNTLKSLFGEEKLKQYENEYNRLEEYDYPKLNEIIDEDDLNKLLNIKNKANKFLEELDNHQIYI